MTDKAFTTGTDVNDFTVVCDLHNLYLKPICKVHITVQISGLSCIGSQGRCLSTWEVSEKLRQLSTVEFVRFVVELDSKADVKRVIKAADSQRIKLSGFPQALRVRAGEAPIDCPRKHDWDAFFRDARDMDELLPGERPDTVVVSKLPVRWFAKPGSSSKLWPDPKDSQTTNDSSSLSFTAYIQYAEYAGFAAAMEALRGKKLVHIPPGKKCTESPCFSAEITVSLVHSVLFQVDAVHCNELGTVIWN
ncbi:unnamed protein product [Mesocestoides corti]|uniref:RRM domain-containing protein n=1 Tax=Mesocestoides corti TaxID=53468 RepID=A0A0R3UJY9_MESCO|nr:unnamed protein product [Mesocestoides corti]